MRYSNKNDALETIKSMNHNVKLVFLFNFFQSFGCGIWMGNILSAYIFLIADESNELLGLTSGITGLAMTLVVLPSGFLSDHFPRKWILRIAAVFGVIGLVFVIFAYNLTLIFLALLFWGLFQGITRPSLEAIFADSVESGSRSRIYSWNHLIRQFAMASGPILNILLFLFLGDIWDIDILKVVMLFGLFISMISLFIMVFFDDKKTLGLASDHIITPTHTVQKNFNEYPRSRSLIILILLSSNILIGFGAGMTIKFFPIFFMKIYNLKPISVQMIMAATFIVTGVTSLSVQKTSIKSGRALMILIVQSIATLCLFIIALYPPIFILVPIFIARGSLMNASQPLSRSILMDVVPKKNRGKINSIEALAWGMFWHFSAAIGGFLIGDNNFRLCFLVTTGLYLIGTIIILIIIPFVAKEKHITQ